MLLSKKRILLTCPNTSEHLFSNYTTDSVSGHNQRGKKEKKKRHFPGNTVDSSEIGYPPEKWKRPIQKVIICKYWFLIVLALRLNSSWVFMNIQCCLTSAHKRISSLPAQVDKRKFIKSRKKTLSYLIYKICIAEQFS